MCFVSFFGGDASNPTLNMARKTVLETTANLCRTLTCISFWKAKGEKKYLLFKLWGSWGKTITDSMFICDGATRHKEREPCRGIFPDSWGGYNQYSQTRARTCDCAVYFFPLLLYEEWSNQARKRVSSVCRRVKRDFQNNPLSRWGFFFYFSVLPFAVLWVSFKIAEEMTIIAQTLSSWMAGPFFFFFSFFREPCTITVLHVHTCDGAVLLFGLLTGHILSNEMLNCFMLGVEAEVIHVSRIKLLYSILQPRWDCGCSSIFNKCLFPRRPCWALWVNSVQEGKACSPHSGAL